MLVHHLLVNRGLHEQQTYFAYGHGVQSTRAFLEKDELHINIIM